MALTMVTAMCVILASYVTYADILSDETATAAMIPRYVLVPEDHAKKMMEGSRKDFEIIINDIEDPSKINLVIEPIDSYVVEITEVSNFQRVNKSNTSRARFQIHAIILGKTEITWSIQELGTGIKLESGSIAVSVIQAQSKYTFIFTIFVIIIVSINNVNMGCLIEIQTIKDVLVKPIAPIIGFVSQFLIMPLGSYLIGWLFFPQKIAWRLGLFTLGCCPGGTGSNFWTLLFDGDVDLSVTMTFISTIAAMGMMPLWMFTLGKSLLQQGNVTIPFGNLLSSLISMTIPLLIGLAIQKYKPTWAKFLRKLLKPFTAFVIIVLVVGGTWISLYIFRLMTWTIVGAGLSIALTGYLCGALLALIFGLNYKQVIAVSIETALQNPGVAFVLLQLSMDQPESDLAAIPIVAQLLMTGIPLWSVYLIYIITKKCCCSKSDSNSESSVKKPSRTPSDAAGDQTTTEPLNAFV